MSIRYGAWAELPLKHPLVPGLRRRCRLPNPAFERCLMLGKPPVIKEKRKDPETGEPTVIEKPIPKTIEMSMEVGNYLRVPRMMVPRNHPDVIDETTLGEAWDFHSRITPRPYQASFIDTLTKAIRDEHGGIGQAAAGYGKTICTLELVSRLGRKTLVLVHKEFLMEQWVERILGTYAAKDYLKWDNLPEEIHPAALGITPDQVGIVRGPKCQWEGKAIVIAMAQTLVSRQYSPEFYESFGTLVVDEVHNFAAPTFQTCITMFPAAYRLGVTATPERKDELETIFFSHIGPIKAVGQVPRVAPRVYRLLTPVVMTEMLRKFITRYDDRTDFNKVLDFICEHEARNRLIIDQLVKATAKGRKVIVLSHRREHLDKLMELFHAECQAKSLVVSTAMYVGGLKKDERKQAERMQVMFATYGMAKEALDVPALDTLFLVTPIGDVEQAVGRIQRQYENKLTPVVTDFVDVAIPTCERLGEKREDEYRRLGWLNKPAA